MSTQAARVKIDLDQVTGRVDRRIFGGFIEHLGRCIDGGIYDEGSPLSGERHFRTDVLEALRPLRMPILRWPGGNFVSGYAWTDGIGPLDVLDVAATRDEDRTSLAVSLIDHGDTDSLDATLELAAGKVAGHIPRFDVNRGDVHGVSDVHNLDAAFVTDRPPW